jgi:hypothetical protein
MSFYSAGTNGAAMRSRAATSPMANEPATTQPMCPLGPASGRGGRSGPLASGVGVGMGVACQRDGTTVLPGAWDHLEM